MEKNATPTIVDLSDIEDIVQKPTGRPRDVQPKGMTPEGYILSKDQYRRRIYRAKKKLEEVTGGVEIAAQVMRYKKPLDEWDNEELARGKPRNKSGKFSGPTPKWVTGELHEAAMDRFTSIVKTGMRVATVDAIEVVKAILNDESTDNRGKPIVAANTKLQAATFLIEHVVGKPTQRMESDVSVKLQGILGAVMVNPEEMTQGGYVPAHLPGFTMELAAAATDGDDTYVIEES